MTANLLRALPREQFAKCVVTWFEQHGRKDLPWQQQRTPYRVWVAEIMLQQTQVSAVIPYYQRFMQRFASIETLAAAPQNEVLHYWSGLGYYARARNLHRAAQIIGAQHGGVFPADFAAVQALPGIGRSTAGAILACSMNQAHPILDGNVKRVLCRYFAIPGYPGTASVASRLWAIAADLMPQTRTADYTQALMDLGATLCTRAQPSCARCPLQSSCRAWAMAEVHLFPAPKPKQKNRRQESLIMLNILRGNAQCALIQQPAKGIWGGLWCPYAFKSMPDLSRWCEENGLNLDDPQNPCKPLGAPIQHSFTHYDLQITPLYIELPGQLQGQFNGDELNDKPPILWYEYATTNAEKIGLATPVAAIIKRLQSQSTQVQSTQVQSTLI